MSETIKENYDVKDSKIDLKKHEDNYSWRHARPTKESFREICEKLNEPRSFRSSDTLKHHFIENIAESPEEAAKYRARHEFYIKSY